MRRKLLATALLAISLPVMAVNRCVDANGRTVYQDRPCEGSQGRPVDVRPNSVDGKLDPDVAKALAQAEAKIKARIAKEDTERVARGARINAHLRECDGYTDEIERQAAWMHSISDAVRASARANIDVARRKYVAAGCAAPNTFY